MMQLSSEESKLEVLSHQDKEIENRKKRMQEFKHVLETNSELTEFNREVFESLVEKVILGGYDEDGNKDPYKITFIYKTGYKDDLYHSKEKYGKKSVAKDVCYTVHSRKA